MIEDEYPYVYLDGIILKQSWQEELVTFPFSLQAEPTKRAIQDSRCYRRAQRRQGGLGWLSEPFERAGSKGCLAVYYRCLHGAGGIVSRILSEEPMAALLGAFLSEHLQCRSSQTGQRCRCHS